MSRPTTRWGCPFFPRLQVLLMNARVWLPCFPPILAGVTACAAKKGALTLKALRAEREKLLGEIEEKKAALLTDGQKAPPPKAAEPGKGP